MSTYIYKNLLLVERNSKHTNSVEMAKTTLNIWFDETSFFQHKGDADKVILYYPNTHTQDAKVYDLSGNNYNPDAVIEGVIHLYIDRTHLRVVRGDFKNSEVCKVFLLQLKEYIHYLIETVSQSDEKKIDDFSFTLEWSCDILNETVKLLVESAGLLNTPEQHKHIFKGSVVLGKSSLFGGSTILGWQGVGGFGKSVWGK